VRWSTDNLPGGRLNQRLYVVVCYVVITIRFLAMRLNLPKWDILINYGTYKIKLWIIRNIKEPSCVEQGIWDFFFFDNLGCPGQLTRTTTNSRAYWTSCKPNRQVRYRGGDRLVHGENQTRDSHKASFAVDHWARPSSVGIWDFEIVMRERERHICLILTLIFKTSSLKFYFLLFLR